jgi:methionyl aminopeptidase
MRSSETTAMIGRNDPCWCGSGKKYKRCHMLMDVQEGAQRPGQAPKPIVKTAEEIEGMRKAGSANGALMDTVRPMIKPGVTSGAIDQFVHEYTLDHGYTPACLGYHNFPKSCCVSVNEVVCHGIPSDSQVLREGDIVNVDLTTIVDGFHGDSSETFFVGEVSPSARHLVEVAARALLKGLGAVRDGAPVEDIAHAIEPFVRSQGCSVVRQYTGHCIGRQFHEGFPVYHHEDPEGQNVIMRSGMTFTVEPMINLGEYRVTTDPADGWTVRTRDGMLSAQFEHTVLVTDTGAEILTLTPSQKAADATIILEGVRLA